MSKNKRAIMLFFLGICALIIIFLLNIALGSVNIAPAEIFRCFFSPENVSAAHRSIIMNIRLPRTLAAIMGGACLSASGVLLQIFFGNPIVEPYILGISSGSTLFLAVVVCRKPVGVECEHERPAASAPRPSRRRRRGLSDGHSKANLLYISSPGRDA